jgi:EmrB/QacA subfamily drug resistance transporter
VSQRTVVPNDVAPPGTLSSRAQMLATGGLLLTLILASIEVSAVGTAMPQVVRELGGLTLYSWIGVSYGVAAAVVIPIAGKLGDMFGRKPFILAGLVGFVIASVLAGVAQSMGMLIVARTLQGLCAGILMANVFTLLGEIYTAERRAQIQGVFFSVAGMSMVVGPPLGGLITDLWGWRWVFYINIPFGLVALLALTAVPYVRSRANWRDVDFLGVLTLVAAVVPLLIGLSLTGDGHPWGSTEVLSLLALGVLMTVAFVVVETRHAGHPIVPFDLFRTNQVTVLVVVGFFSAFAMAGTMFYVPLLYQGVLGVNATFSGSLLIPLALAIMVVPPVTGRLLGTVARYRFLGTAAFACMVGGMLLLVLVNPGGNRSMPLIAMVGIGVGIGITLPLATTVVQSSVPMSQIGVATSQVQFWRTFANPLAIAILGAILSSQIGPTNRSGAVAPEPLAGALHDVFLVGALLSAIGLVATLLLKEVPLRQMPKKAPPQVAQEPAAQADS